MARINFLRLLLSVLLIGIALLIINSIFIAEPAYRIYAKIFNHGQLYEGETRGVMQLDLFFYFIIPINLMLAFCLAIATKNTWRATLWTNFIFILLAAFSVIFFTTNNGIQANTIITNGSLPISANGSAGNIN
ncbi:hypothetical protein [Pseudomonas sp. 5P_3.1_Bac2]|uniref:hypothetical protein n=1 Tax=Pseudomonas sp. 5P_3.1_Bac2 TaxID=2971617 RepID=UPI0021C65BAC|nr:hypothetical protein [Pseudomonas sp. 5P_3.1_Bac2]MCU1718966.1 hypothetical protein [Pseudomonas sp. 5P_3.1_Bac2]